MQLLWVTKPPWTGVVKLLYKYTDCPEATEVTATLRKLSIVRNLHDCISALLEWIILLFCLNLLFKVKPLL